jgi:hypothetical protein
MRLTHIGREFLLLRRPFHRSRPVEGNATDLSSIDGALSELASALAGVPSWRLSGGMALAIHAGRFYRTHGDFDILVDRGDLAQFVTGQTGYRLFRDLLWFPHLGDTIHLLRIVRRLDPDRTPRGPLRLVRTDHALSVPGMTRVIDVATYEHNGSMVSRSDGKIEIRGDLFSAAPYATSTGASIPLVGLAWLDAVKRRRNRRVDRMDARVIRDLKRSGKPVNTSAGSGGIP